MEPPSSRTDFAADYTAALVSHVGSPGESGLQIAYELGRRALHAGLSMLELVGIHLTARRVALAARGIDALGDVDAFLTEALAAFEIAQRGFVESNHAAAAAKQRADVLRGLSEAYVKIATPTTLADRLEQVCVQARQFLDATDARLEFGRRRTEPPDPDLADLDEMSALLDSSGARLVLRAKPGRIWSDVDRATLDELAVLISAPIDDARRLDFTQRLEHVGAQIGEAVDQQAIVDRLREAGRAGTGAADVLLRLDGHPEPVSDLDRVLGDVAAGGHAVFRNHDEDDSAEAALPLDAASRRLGAIGFHFDEHQPFDLVQRGFLVQLADRVATALERGRTYERERLARQDAEVASTRYRELQELATGLARAATRRHVAQLLLRRSVASSLALGGVIATFDRGRRAEALATSGTLASGSASGDELLGDVLAELEELGPQAAPADLTADLRRRLEAAGVGTFGAYPIRAGRRAIGVLGLGWAGTTPPPDVDALVRAQVAMAGPALLRAERYDVDHDIANTLQRSFLSLPPVDLQGVRWSVHYRAGSAGLAGGDWYDLYPLDDRRVAVTVGDVVGRGVQAAAVMGQLRSATRAMAALIDDPGELLTALDSFVTTSEQGRYSSIAYAVLDTVSGELRHAVAGHPPPLLRIPDGPTRLLESGHGPLLGVPCERTTASVTMPSGSLLVLYTDGLVERRNELVDAGLARLVQAVDDAPAVEPEALCSHLAAQLSPTDGASDDVAILALQRR